MSNCMRVRTYLRRLASLPQTPPEPPEAYPDPDPDLYLPPIQLRRTRKHVLPIVPTYSRLGQMHVALSPRDVLVPAPPRQVLSRRSQRQSNEVKCQAIALMFCTPTVPDAPKLKLISAITHISIETLHRLKKKAIARGFDPTKDLRVEEWYIDDAKPLGPCRTATNVALPLVPIHELPQYTTDWVIGTWNLRGEAYIIFT
jgi:hypothetical protein